MGVSDCLCVCVCVCVYDIPKQLQGQGAVKGQSANKPELHVDPKPCFMAMLVRQTVSIELCSS